jgi:hypothetical protein
MAGLRTRYYATDVSCKVRKAKEREPCAMSNPNPVHEPPQKDVVDCAGLTACACGTRHLGLACHESPQPTLSPRRILGAYAACNELRTHRSLNKDPALRRPSRAACSASVSHLSAISMKSDLCCEVRAASANRMHSAALLRNWSKLGKSAFISIDMGTERAHRQRFVISRSMSFK